MNTLERFEQELKGRGFGIAPNGAAYRFIGTEDEPKVERTSVNGYRAIIVGYNSAPFVSFPQAEAWAIQDGRRKLVVDVHGCCSAPLHEREVIT